MADETGQYEMVQDDLVDDLSIETLQTVVILQRTELRRLLREQARLNDRIDSLLKLHEREQVLRQQMQAALDRLAAVQVEASHRAASLTYQAVPEVDDLRARLERTEHRFTALQGAVGDLIAYIERTRPGNATSRSNDGHVRIFAPG